MTTPSAAGSWSLLSRARAYAREPFVAGDTSTAEGRARERHRRIVLTGATATASRLVGIAVNFVSIPLAVSYLGNERYGVWATLASFTAFAAFADLGISNSLITLLAAADGTSDRDAARCYVSTAVVALGALAVAVAAGFAAIYAFVPWDEVFNVSSSLAASEVGPATLAFVCCFLLALPLGIIPRIQIAYQEGFAASLWTALGSVFSLAALIVVIQLDLGLAAVVAALAGAPLVALIVNGGVVFGRRYSWLRPAPRAATWAAARTIVRLGGLFFALQAAAAIAYETDNIVIAQVLGADAVTHYAIPFRVFAAVGLVLSLILMPLWPAYSEAIARRDHAWVRRTLVRSLKLGLAVSIPAAVFLLLFGRTLVSWWVGEELAPPFALVAGLAAWLVLTGVNGAIAMFLNGASVIRFQVVCAALMAAANLGLSIVLARAIGLPGPIFATLIAQILFVVVPSLVYIPRKLNELQRDP